MPNRRTGTEQGARNGLLNRATPLGETVASEYRHRQSPISRPEHADHFSEEREIGHSGTFMVTGRAGAALLAGKGHEHLVRAANAGEALVQIGALEKGRYAAFDDGASEGLLSRKPLVVDLLEALEMLVQQTPQVGGMRIARAVQRHRLDTGGDHGRNGTGSGSVYTRQWEHLYT